MILSSGYRLGGVLHALSIWVLLGVLHILLPFLRRGDARLAAPSRMFGVVEVWQAEDADFLFPSRAVEERSPENLPQEDGFLALTDREKRAEPRQLGGRPSVLQACSGSGSALHFHSPGGGRGWELPRL